MNATLLTTILRLQFALLDGGGRLARALDRRLTARPGQGAVEYAFLTGAIAVGVAAALAVLTGALADYFQALVDFLNTHKPV